MKIFVFKRKSILKVMLVVLLLSSSIIYTGINKDMKIVGVFGPKRELPIYSVETDKKQVAISFDAAWGTEFTQGILDTLDKYNVKTTFFLVGFWVDKNPDMVKMINERGHEIGNHSNNHPHMSQLNESQMTEEILKTHEKIKAITNKDSILFRPPFGDYNDLLINTLRVNNYYTIQWDVDSLDWKELGVQSVVDRVTRNVKNGSIILFHNNAKYVGEYLPLVLEKLQSEGYEIVPISELIYKDDFYLDHTGRQMKNK